VEHWVASGVLPASVCFEKTSKGPWRSALNQCRPRESPRLRCATVCRAWLPTLAKRSRRNGCQVAASRIPWTAAGARGTHSHSTPAWLAWTIATSNKRRSRRRPAPSPRRATRLQLEGRVACVRGIPRSHARRPDINDPLPSRRETQGCSTWNISRSCFTGKRIPRPTQPDKQNASSRLRSTPPLCRPCHRICHPCALAAPE
jgi:hypothetical protein